MDKAYRATSIGFYFKSESYRFPHIPCAFHQARYLPEFHQYAPYEARPCRGDFVLYHHRYSKATYH